MFLFNIYDIYQKSKFQISFASHLLLTDTAQQKGPPVSGPASPSYPSRPLPTPSHPPSIQVRPSRTPSLLTPNSQSDPQGIGCSIQTTAPRFVRFVQMPSFQTVENVVSFGQLKEVNPMTSAITINNLQDVQKINEIACSFYYDTWVHGETEMMDAKSFLGLVSLIGKPNLNFVVPDDEEAKSAIKMVKKYFHQ